MHIITNSNSDSGVSRVKIKTLAIKEFFRDDIQEGRFPPDKHVFYRLETPFTQVESQLDKLSDKIKTYEYYDKVVIRNVKHPIDDNNFMELYNSIFIAAPDRSIGVLPKYRGKKFGLNLLKTAINYLKDKKITKLICEVYHENEASLKMFQGLGMEIVGQMILEDEQPIDGTSTQESNNNVDGGK